MVNSLGLHFELLAAGITIGGCRTSGEVWDVNGVAIQNRPDVAAVIAAHDKVAWDVREASWKAKRDAARVAAKNIPNYATWTVAEWTTWYNANISATQVNAIANLADAKVVLARMSTVCDGLAKMVVALRDLGWSDLADYVAGTISMSQK